MKTGIHPKVHKKVVATCGCGATFIFDSTAEVIKTEICSACHPFYTGKQKLLDTAGKVDKFRARVAAAKKSAASKKKGKISENVKAAAAAVGRNSAVDSAKAVNKVKNAVQKRELKKAKLEEELKSKKVESEKAEAESSEPVEQKEE
ncbi:50S ribosomal protein L31 [Candidatus Gracilibacteria bacterium]|nr:50S ribosomal protein L31 [Candidatus Gracilibacteria bacterium]MCF7856736.1 50S ribosomal protein L31 [Candidatus Gracilibacteria bacterium]MCF7896944.1 50S ribosomal protein L31 [Candidatus Gracilibacteria bacterium]